MYQQFTGGHARSVKDPYPVYANDYQGTAVGTDLIQGEGGQADGVAGRRVPGGRDGLRGRLVGPAVEHPLGGFVRKGRQVKVGGPLQIGSDGLVDP